MTVSAYEAKFHALSRHATQLVTTEKEKIWLFVKGLNSKLYVLFVHVTTAGKSINEVTNFVKKVEGVGKVGKAKALPRRPKGSSNFQGSYFSGPSM